MVTTKLEAQRITLYDRIGKKKKNKQGGEWFFSPHYRDKFEFVRKLYKDYKKVPADIRIETSKLKPNEVYKVAQKKLECGTLRLMMSD